MKIRIFLFLFAILLLSISARAGGYSFYCKSKDWRPSAHFAAPVFLYSSCEILPNKNTIKKACLEWADRWHLDSKSYDVVIAGQDSFCDGSPLTEIDELDHKFYSQIQNPTHVLKPKNPDTLVMTFAYTNQTKNELPLELSPGVEQSQWISIGQERYCGILGDLSKNNGLLLKFTNPKDEKVLRMRRSRNSEEFLYDLFESREKLNVYKIAHAIPQAPDFITLSKDGVNDHEIKLLNSTGAEIEKFLFQYHEIDSPLCN